jgi:hypothetical protein
MQIPGAQQLAPNVFSYTGQANAPSEMQSALANRTMAFLQAHFPHEIGVGVRKVTVRPYALEMTVPPNMGSLTVVLETMHKCLKNLTLEKVGLFVQRDSVAVMRFDLEDGPRYLAVQSFPVACPIDLVATPEGLVAIDVKLAHFQGRMYLNICTVDRSACFQCGRSAERMFKCEGCKQVRTVTRYCSKECQEAHWPVHQAFCGW